MMRKRKDIRDRARNKCNLYVGELRVSLLRIKSETKEVFCLIKFYMEENSDRE